MSNEKTKTKNDDELYIVLIMSMFKNLMLTRDVKQFFDDVSIQYDYYNSDDDDDNYIDNYDNWF